MNALLNYKKNPGILLTEDIRFCKMVAEVFQLETLKKKQEKLHNRVYERRNCSCFFLLLDIVQRMG